MTMNSSMVRNECMVDNYIGDEFLVLIHLTTFFVMGIS